MEVLTVLPPEDPDMGDPHVSTIAYTRDELVGSEVVVIPQMADQIFDREVTGVSWFQLYSVDDLGIKAVYVFSFESFGHGVLRGGGG